MKLIVGLGNPEAKYNNTRHNIGFQAVDYLATCARLKWSEKKDWQAIVAKGADYILVKPLTYMNNSGEAVSKIAKYYKLGDGTAIGDDLIVIHDELDLPLGEVRKSCNSSAAGHNGIKSIINFLGGQNFCRYRLGIKTEGLNKSYLGLFKTSPAKFVLNHFTASEQIVVKKMIEQKAIELNID